MNKVLICWFCLVLGFGLSACQKEEWLFSLSDLDDSVMYEVNIRNYTEAGTFQAFMEHLPKLQALGVDVLWLMPIHPISETKRNGTLGSFYSISDYDEVNPEFGSKDDFYELMQKAHEMGFTVLMDLVVNHTGWDHAWISDHPDWYTQDDQGNIIIPEGTNWHDVADLNFDNEELRAELIKMMKYWVTEFDVDGFRCDAAGMVPRDFWVEAIASLNEVKTLFWLAEDDGDFSLVDHLFSANYSFEFMNLIKEIASGDKTASHLPTFINKNKTRYPKGVFPLIYTSNHDVNAWEGPTEALLGAGSKAFNVLAFTMPGMPMIYSGQEVSFNESLAFFDKDEIIWGDYEDNDQFLFYQKLISLKKEQKALALASFQNITVFYDDNIDILCYGRASGESKIIVLVNLSDEAEFVNIDFADFTGNYQDYFLNEVVIINEQMSFTLEPWAYRVLVG